jgi:hypothetical protein
MKLLCRLFKLTLIGQGGHAGQVKTISLKNRRHNQRTSLSQYVDDRNLLFIN